MEQKPPKNIEYRIKYIDCAQQHHQGEKLNLVCLENGCKNNSLICSLCKEGKHLGHSIQPLKFYLQELRKKYQQASINYIQQLDNLQKSRTLFLIKLQQAVLKIAQQLRILQQEALDRFQAIRNQILQNESRKNQFHDFYRSLTLNSYQQQPQFLIQNYLPKQNIARINNLDCFTKLTMTTCNQIIKIKQSMLLQPLNLPAIAYFPAEQSFLKPQNIMKLGQVITQNNDKVNQPSLCLMNRPINNWDGKIKIKILSLKKGGKVTFGVITKQYFNTLKYHWNFQVSPQVKWINHQGKNNNAQSSTITNLAQGSQLQISVIKPNYLKIATRKNNSMFNISNGKQWYFFMAMQGKTKIQFVYPVK